jgi:hypothetical protein
LTDENKQILIEKVELPAAAIAQSLISGFTDAEQQNPQHGLDWLQNLTQHALDDGDGAVIYIARTSPDNFVALPLKRHTGGRKLEALSTFYTSAFAPTVVSSEPTALFCALFKHLRTKEKITQLTLAPLEEESPVFDQLQQAFKDAGFAAVHSYFCFANWSHPLPQLEEGYLAYLDTRPSRLRNTIKRKTKSFLKEGRGSMKMITDVAALPEAIAEFTKVYNNSWKREEPYPDFIPQLLHLAAKRGWLRLGIASYDGAPIAGQIWLVCDNSAYIFKLAYDEQFKTLSAGTVVTAFMMEHVIDQDRVERIDYLSGDDAYKRDWMSVRRERQGIAAYNPDSLSGGTMTIVHYLKRLVKRER